MTQSNKTLFVSFDSDNETYDIHSEDGKCLFYSSDAEAITNYLSMIGATKTNELTWSIDNGTLSKITNSK